MLAFVISLPRSGSTVLTSLLDKRKGILCHPESSFPQIYGELSYRIKHDPRSLAAYYISSTFAGTPLNLDEATECMRDNLEDTLYALGDRLCEKIGRPADEVNTHVWKTTRTVGMNKAILDTKGRFIVLRRNPHNVFESQFRVGFGKNNRNPLRFALFRASYESSFEQLPPARRLDVEYDDLPEAISTVLEFLGCKGDEVWDSGVSSLEAVARNRPWLSEITNGFANRDHEKLARINKFDSLLLDFGLNSTRFLSPVLSLARRHYDMASLRTVSEHAERILNGLD